MGLIRKTLSVATPVRPESKKQRVQSAILAELRAANAPAAPRQLSADEKHTIALARARAKGQDMRPFWER